jgi:hypothetical protein
MTKKRYGVTCRECGKIDSDGPSKTASAYRRAGFHEGLHDGDHVCDVRVVDETNEYRCPVCHTKCIGERERDEHAKTEPGVSPGSFVRV